MVDETAVVVRSPALSQRLFTVRLTHPTFVERGHTVRFWARFEHFKDGLIDPTSLALRFFDSSDTQVGLTSTPTKDSQGLYFGEKTFAAADKLGPMVVEWSGTYSSLQILARAFFRLIRTVH